MQQNDTLFPKLTLQETDQIPHKSPPIENIVNNIVGN
jgi:hypothetical protein